MAHEMETPPPLEMIGSTLDILGVLYVLVYNSEILGISSVYDI